jgi:hypothetical protein
MAKSKYPKIEDLLSLQCCAGMYLVFGRGKIRMFGRIIEIGIENNRMKIVLDYLRKQKKDSNWHIGSDNKITFTLSRDQTVFHFSRFPAYMFAFVPWDGQGQYHSFICKEKYVGHAIQSCRD